MTGRRTQLPRRTRNGSHTGPSVREHRRDDLETQMEVMREMLRAGGASMVYHFMSEDDLTRIMRHSNVSFASDSGLNRIGGQGSSTVGLSGHVYGTFLC